MYMVLMCVSNRHAEIDSFMCTYSFLFSSLHSNLIICHARISNSYFGEIACEWCLCCVSAHFQIVMWPYLWTYIFLYNLCGFIILVIIAWPFGFPVLTNTSIFHVVQLILVNKWLVYPLGIFVCLVILLENISYYCVVFTRIYRKYYLRFFSPYISRIPEPMNVQKVTRETVADHI
jgi:hypothetical protein